MAGNISLGVLTIIFALFVTSSGRGHDVLIGNSVALLALGSVIATFFVRPAHRIYITAVLLLPWIGFFGWQFFLRR
jgi:hypothetical protein